MKKFLAAICATMLSMVIALSSVVPVSAMPIQTVVKSQYSDVVDVQYRRSPHHSGSRHHSRPSSRPHGNSHSRPHHRQPPRHHYRHSRPGTWHGHRGSRHYRSGYRRHNDGWWYPAAAFTAGAIIGSAASRPAPVVIHNHPTSRTSQHIEWCRNRYRTYRVSDNTFQPNSGPRRQCVSPF